MNRTINLWINFLCPFARRTLLSKEFKGIDLTVTEVDFTNKPADFLAASPLGKVPAMKLTQEGKEYPLCESLQIIELFDSFPGPPLYPRLPDGQTSPLYKAIIDAHIQVFIAPWTGHILGVLVKTPQYQENVKKYLDQTQLLNDKFLSKGDYFMSGVIPYDGVTIADIALLGHAYFAHYLKNNEPELYEGRDLSHFWKWYDRLAAQEWVSKYNQSDQRVGKLFRMYRDGTHRGLLAPVTLYDVN